CLRRNKFSAAGCARECNTKIPRRPTSTRTRRAIRTAARNADLLMPRRVRDHSADNRLVNRALKRFAESAEGCARTLVLADPSRHYPVRSYLPPTCPTLLAIFVGALQRTSLCSSRPCPYELLMLRFHGQL